MKSENTLTTVVINIGKIENGEALIKALKGNNVILDEMPLQTTKSELKERIDLYRDNALIQEIILLNEASHLLMEEDISLKLKK